MKHFPQKFKFLIEPPYKLDVIFIYIFGHEIEMGKWFCDL